MFEKLKVRDYQIIVITDGGKGAYAFDGQNITTVPYLTDLLCQRWEQVTHLHQHSVLLWAEQKPISGKP